MISRLSENRNTILVTFLIVVAKHQIKNHRGGSVCFGSCFERILCVTWEKAWKLKQ